MSLYGNLERCDPTKKNHQKNHHYCPYYRPQIKREHQCHPIDLIFNSFSINSRKILKMNLQGDNIIVFNSIQIKNESKFSNWIAFSKKKIDIKLKLSIWCMTMNSQRLLYGGSFSITALTTQFFHHTFYRASFLCIPVMVNNQDMLTIHDQIMFADEWWYEETGSHIF